MLAYLAPIALFTGIVTSLAATVLFVRGRIAVRVPASITVNGQRQVETMTGETLLGALGAAGVHLPSACGGRGTCGQCRVTVVDGASAPLPTERNHISEGEARRGVRLACVSRVRGDLSITVAAGILDARRYACRVAAIRHLATYLRELTLCLPQGEHFEFRAGDYVLVTAPAAAIEFRHFAIDPTYSREWNDQDLWRHAVRISEPTTRAYSIANAPGDRDPITLVVRIALPPPSAPRETPPGLVSSYLFSLREGDPVSVAGPFGEFHARAGEREMILIGGGAGIAPLRSIIRDELLGKHSRRKIRFFYGARNRSELVYATEFDELARQYDNFVYEVALSAPQADESWQGHVGFIHRIVYSTYLAAHPNPEAAEYYLCGPPLMSSAVLALLEDLGVDRESILFDDFGASTGAAPG